MAALDENELAEPLLPRSDADNSCGDQPTSPDASEAEESAPRIDSHIATDDIDEASEGDSENASPPALPPNPYRNPNVILSFILCIVSGIADSIWGSVILSAFLLAYVKIWLASRLPPCMP
jgi:hypothetical protein